MYVGDLNHRFWIAQFTMERNRMGSQATCTSATLGSIPYSHVVSHKDAQLLHSISATSCVCVCCGVFHAAGQLGCCSGAVPAAQGQPAGCEGKQCDLQHSDVSMPHTGQATERE